MGTCFILIFYSVFIVGLGFYSWLLLSLWLILVDSRQIVVSLVSVSELVFFFIIFVLILEISGCKKKERIPKKI